MFWLSTLSPYTLAPDHTLTAERIIEAIEQRPKLPCGASDCESQGFGKVAEHTTHDLAHVQQNAVLVALHVETKLLPASVIKANVAERIKQVEAAEHRKVGRKEVRELRELAVESLLPKAFSKLTVTRALIDLEQNRVYVDANSPSKAERVLSALRDALGSMPARLIQTNTSPRVAMTNWVKAADAGEFDLGQDAELHMPGNDGARARLVRQVLGSDEVQQHLASGKEVVKLGLMFRDRVAFQLTEKLEVKRFSMLDQLADDMKCIEADDQAALFQSGFALLLGEVRELMPTLISELDGEA